MRDLDEPHTRFHQSPCQEATLAELAAVGVAETPRLLVELKNPLELRPGKPERFADHYTQATLFWNSQTPVERAHIEFRAEAFNLTNSPLFNAPGLSLGGSTFGVVTSQQNAPRQIQLVLKVLF